MNEQELREQIAKEIEAMGECACEIDETDGEIVSPCWRCIHAAIARRMK